MQEYVRHRRGRRYKKPLLRDPLAIKSRDLLVMSMLFGLSMAGIAAAALGVI